MTANNDNVLAFDVGTLKTLTRSRALEKRGQQLINGICTGRNGVFERWPEYSIDIHICELNQDTRTLQ